MNNTIPVVLVTPSVQRAILSEVLPKVGIKRTTEFAEYATLDWAAKEKNKYLGILASSICEGLKASDLEARVGSGLPQVFKRPNMAQINYPTVTLKLQNGKQIKVTSTTSIPTTRFAKGYHKSALAHNWVSVDVSHDDCNGSAEAIEKMTMEFSALPEYIQLCNNITQALSEWEFERMGREGYTNYCSKFARRNTLRIITIGVRDERLFPYFTRLDEDDEGLGKILKEPIAGELFSTYFGAAGLDGNVVDLTGNKPPKVVCFLVPALHFTLPLINDGCYYANSRPTIYVRRDLKEVTVVAGISHDDSIDCKLAAKAASEVVSFMKRTI